MLFSHFYVAKVKFTLFFVAKFLFVHFFFVRKVFARTILLSGKFSTFLPLTLGVYLTSLNSNSTVHICLPSLNSLQDRFVKTLEKGSCAGGALARWYFSKWWNGRYKRHNFFFANMDIRVSAQQPSHIISKKTLCFD